MLILFHRGQGMDLLKVRAVGFAVRNRLKGYKLLQNPNGSSPYEVKMVKKWSGIDGTTLDRYDHYYSVSRDFSKPDAKTEKETMLVTKYMFWKNKNDKQTMKEILYMKDCADGSHISKQKFPPVDYEEIYNRDLSYIEKDRNFGTHEEVRLPFLRPAQRKRVPTIESVREREVEKFFEEQKKNQPAEESFWKTLIRNLKGN